MTVLVTTLIFSLWVATTLAQEGEPEATPQETTGEALLPTVPVDLAEGRLRVVGLSVFPPDPTFYPVAGRLMDAWSTCAVESEISECGHQVMRAEVDRHTNDVSLSFYVDELTNLPLEACVHEAMRNPPTHGPAEAGPFGYVVALVVSPDAAMLDSCAEGVLEAATPYLPE